jgi:hypothetical protein
MCVLWVRGGGGSKGGKEKGERGRKKGRISVVEVCQANVRPKFRLKMCTNNRPIVRPTVRPECSPERSRDGSLKRVYVLFDLKKC